LLLALALAGGARGADADSTPEFPADPESWLNSGPLTVGSLKGKAAFLWFFEESCPTCRAKWPGLLETARKFEGKPVVFIAVNSGNSRGEVAEYVRQVGCNWPTLVDGTREYEKAALGREISLSNICQVRVIRPDGTMQYGDWSKIEPTVENALQGAAWKVDPAEVPEGLKPAWLNIEFGNYPAAAAIVKKSLTSKKGDLKAGAEKLNSAVQAEIAPQLTAAADLLAKGEKWRAYQIYNAIGQTYGGFELPADSAQNKKKLAADPAIKGEMTAAQNLDRAKKIIASGRPNSRKTIAAMLEKLVKEQGDTTAGAEAKQMLKRLGDGESGGGENK
jgi:thiol-disulfide isomerase/thioredoxin